MARSEADFSYQIRTDISEVFGHSFVHLLPDMFRTGKKPFDFFVLLDGKFVAFEAKFNKGNTFNIENAVRPHQPECLKQVIKAGGFGYFLFYFKNEDALLMLDPYQIEEKPRFKFCDFDDSFKIKREKISGRKRWHVEKLFFGLSTLNDALKKLAPISTSMSSPEITDCVKPVEP